MNKLQQNQCKTGVQTGDKRLHGPTGAIVFANADNETQFISNRQLACSLCPYGIPDVAIEVVVAGQQQPTRLRERH